MAAGIPTPPDFTGNRKSYTLAASEYAPASQSSASIGVLCLDDDYGMECYIASRAGLIWITLLYMIRWHDNQLYVAGCQGMSYAGVSPNKKDGATISVKKRGGWSESYRIARILAKWAPCTTIRCRTLLNLQSSARCLSLCLPKPIRTRCLMMPTTPRSDAFSA